jgi:light-regulated signal transduction histidine kinase (bacteriophytochrome)
VVEQVRTRIHEIFGHAQDPPQDIDLAPFVVHTIDGLRSHFSHRSLSLSVDAVSIGCIHMPGVPLRKVVTGLVKNAVENTPDEGRIEVKVNRADDALQLSIRDTGVGIVAEHQKRIFEGFFPTQETIAYSTKRPYEFNAGGRGADLLRTKIFSERFNFKVRMTSRRCRYIPEPNQACPGRISQCRFCAKPEDCYDSGGTAFIVNFRLP